MPNEAMILGKIRGTNQDELLASNADEEQVRLSGQGEQLYAMGASVYQENTRLGRTFWTNNTTPVAAVIAMPTTAVNLAIYNNEPDGGRSYVIQRVSAVAGAAGAVLYQAYIIGCLGQTREAIAAMAAMTLKQANGGGKNDSRARVIIGGTAITGVAATNWFCLSNSQVTLTASVIGWQIDAPINGRFIVSPGRYFAVHVLGSAVGLTATMNIYWTEKMLLLG